MGDREKLKKPGKIDQTERILNFDLYEKRFVALKMCYIGFGYHGFEYQGEDVPTIEKELFSVFRQMRLVQGQQQEWRYSKCGRTDKGVSSYSQVVAILLRTSRRTNSDLIFTQTELDEMDEKLFVHAVNRKLPNNIKILAWAPVSEKFHARFSCTSRTYFYTFPVGNLNIEWMQTAAKLFVGTHNFRNFCKAKRGEDQEKVSYIRRLDICDIFYEPSRNIARITVNGSSFLWHQVRMMTGLLLFVGMGKEKPTIVQELLDVKKYPSKPASAMASPVPLVLAECEFNENVDWRFISDSSSLLGLNTIMNESMCKDAVLSELFEYHSLKKSGQLTFLLSDPSDGSRNVRFLNTKPVTKGKRQFD